MSAKNRGCRGVHSSTFVCMSAKRVRTWQPPYDTRKRLDLLMLVFNPLPPPKIKHVCPAKPGLLEQPRKVLRDARKSAAQIPP